MTHDETKFRLKACRPNGQDSDDPALREALEQAQNDPELQAWLERERAFDRAVAERLRQVVPPANLRQSIMAGVAVTGVMRRAWWRTPWVLAMAAAFVVLLSSALLVWRPVAEEPITGAEELLRLAHADVRDGGPSRGGGAYSATLNDVRRWLESPDTKLSEGMPFQLKQLKDGGCRIIPAGGCEVVQICFKRDKLYHVYVAPRARFKKLQLQDLPILQQQGGVALATWADEHYVYVLATREGLEAVRALL
jgi:hypothetical protein